MPLGRVFEALRRTFASEQVGGHALNSPEDYAREMQRLQRELEIVREKRERERAEFHARHRILGSVPPHGGMSLTEVEQQLANLQRIRQDRLEAEARAYEGQIGELARQARERFGDVQVGTAISNPPSR